MTRGGNLGHVRAVQARTTDVLSRIDECWQQNHVLQDLERAGLDRRGARLPVRLLLPFDEPRFHAMAGELRGGEQPGRACSDD